MIIRQEQLDALEKALGTPLVQRCVMEEIGSSNSAGPLTEADAIKCLQSLCKIDKSLVERAGKIPIALRGPKRLEYWHYTKGQWVKEEKEQAISGGTTFALAKEIHVKDANGIDVVLPKGSDVIMLNRNVTCGQLKVNFYHEMVHARQDVQLPLLERERRAYKETEHWAVDNDLPSQNPAFRIPHGDHRAEVDEHAIDEYVDKQYAGDSKKPTNSPAGKTLRIMSVKDDGKTLVYEDGSTAPVFEGARYERDAPGQDLAIHQIPSSAFKCP